MYGRMGIGPGRRVAGTGWRPGIPMGRSPRRCRDELRVGTRPYHVDALIPCSSIMATLPGPAGGTWNRAQYDDRLHRDAPLRRSAGLMTGLRPCDSARRTFAAYANATLEDVSPRVQRRQTLEARTSIITYSSIARHIRGQAAPRKSTVCARVLRGAGGPGRDGPRACSSRRIFFPDRLGTPRYDAGARAGAAGQGRRDARAGAGQVSGIWCTAISRGAASARTRWGRPDRPRGVAERAEPRLYH